MTIPLTNPDETVRFEMVRHVLYSHFGWGEMDEHHDVVRKFFKKESYKKQKFELPISVGALIALIIIEHFLSIGLTNIDAKVSMGEMPPLVLNEILRSAEKVHPTASMGEYIFHVADGVIGYLNSLD